MGWGVNSYLGNAHIDGSLLKRGIPYSYPYSVHGGERNVGGGSLDHLGRQSVQQSRHRRQRFEPRRVLGKRLFKH